MISNLYSLFTTGFYRNIWLKLIVLFSILFIGIYIYKKINTIPKTEGFSQNDNFILKTNNDIYDDFYGEIYDTIHKPELRVPYEIHKIIETTQADDNSIFLDIGSGSGYVVNELNELGYDAYGVDKSFDMVRYSEDKYTNSIYKQGDVYDSMLFDKNIFSHILCLYYTIYQFKDKRTFFKNCYFWLKPGGYLIIHLVEPSKFDTTVPASKHILFGSPQNFYDERLTEHSIDFDSFKYKSSYIFNDTNSDVVFKETFTDTLTTKIRQNEQILYMENIESIVTIAKQNGFIAHGMFDLKEEHQYLYIFERTL